VISTTGELATSVATLPAVDSSCVVKVDGPVDDGAVAPAPLEL
jgi:hypothetical protein